MGPRISIIAVVVLYQCRPDQSSTMASLVHSWEHCSNTGLELKVIIYDNSPERQPGTLTLPFAHQYIHDAANGGLAAAYNHALDSDSGGQYQWLLLLDQDSDLPEDYIALTAGALVEAEREDEVAAVVPRVTHGNRPLSPARLQWWGGVRPVPEPAPGIWPGPLTAINSGALLRKSFLSEIGGFNRQFRLDYLDHWLFSEINRCGKKTYVSPVRIEHDLSIWHRTGTVPPERYRFILEAETLFYRTCLKRRIFKYHLLNLAVRACRQWLSGEWQLSRLTIRHLNEIAANR